MKKALTLFVFATLFAAHAFASYVVVLKDGTRYIAKSKWTVVNGKAIVKLENGQSLQIDPSLIDEASSEKLTKLGITTANLIDLTPKSPAGQPAPAKEQKPSIGNIKLRQRTEGGAAAQQPVPLSTPSSSTTPVPTVAGTISMQVIDKFDRAYENIGIFEKKLASTGARSLRAEVTVDTEEKVFNAISATSFLIVRNAGVDNVQIDMVELFMKTTTGGAAGRFQMTRADAEAIDKRTVSQQDYFVKNVIY